MVPGNSARVPAAVRASTLFPSQLPFEPVWLPR